MILNRLQHTISRATRAMVRAGAIGVVGLVCVLGTAQQVRAQALMKEPPKEIRGLELKDRRGEKVPLDLPLVNEEGKTVALGSFFNQPSFDGKASKPVIIVMAYYRCPMLCPLVINTLSKTLGEIDPTVGKDYNVVVVSFDPRDTPKDAALHKQSTLLGYGRSETKDDLAAVERGWNFTIAAPDDARKLGDALGFPYRYLPETGEYSHGAALFVLTPGGTISRYLAGIKYPAKDVRLALVDASGGKVGGLFDLVSLWCYHFDPSAGAYSLQAMKVMRIGGGASAVFLLGLLGVLWRSEVKKKRRQALSVDRSEPVVAGMGSVR
jgi:protein SCO1/2